MDPVFSPGQAHDPVSSTRAEYRAKKAVAAATSTNQSDIRGLIWRAARTAKTGAESRLCFAASCDILCFFAEKISR
jgi:hypothetical protein